MADQAYCVWNPVLFEVNVHMVTCCTCGIMKWWSALCVPVLHVITFLHCGFVCTVSSADQQEREREREVKIQCSKNYSALIKLLKILADWQLS